MRSAARKFGDGIEDNSLCGVAYGKREMNLNYDRNSCRCKGWNLRGNCAGSAIKVSKSDRGLKQHDQNAMHLQMRVSSARVVLVCPAARTDLCVQNSHPGIPSLLQKLAPAVAQDLFQSLIHETSLPRSDVLNDCERTAS